MDHAPILLGLRLGVDINEMKGRRAERSRGFFGKLTPCWREARAVRIGPAAKRIEASIVADREHWTLGSRANRPGRATFISGSMRT
jgi:hypothetical protein